VDEEQLSLAIGKRGQNVRLAARLTGWDIDILTPPEFNAGLDALERVLGEIEGLGPEKIDKVLSMGLISLLDLEEVGPELLGEELEIEAEVATTMVARASEEARKIAASAEQAKAEQEAAEAEALAAAEATDGEDQVPSADAAAEADSEVAAESKEDPSAAPESPGAADADEQEAPPAVESIADGPGAASPEAAEPLEADPPPTDAPEPDEPAAS
jgi:N utilization substance protein A